MVRGVATNLVWGYKIFVNMVDDYNQLTFSAISRHLCRLSKSVYTAYLHPRACPRSAAPDLRLPT